MNEIGLLINRFLSFVVAAGHDVAEHGHDMAEHAEEHADHPELVNFILIIRHWLENTGKDQLANWFHSYENTIFILIIVALISFWAFNTYRKTLKGEDAEARKRIPRGLSQNFWEIIVQGLGDFTEQGLGLGKKGRTYIPLIGSLFLFILLNNLFGVIPFMKSATSSLNTTLGLAIIVFFTVQIHGIRALGLKGYLLHLAGIEPGVTVTYFLWPLFLPLHVLGELIKPLSLALRLFGNIFGEDILLAVFVGLGAFALIPLQTPFYFLALLMSFIQTMVFTLLACSYIASMSHVHEAHGD